MIPKNLAKIDPGTHAFAKWKCAEEKVSKLEKQFNDALALYSKGNREFPEPMYAELKELRREADALFLLAAHMCIGRIRNKLGDARNPRELLALSLRLGDGDRRNCAD